MTKYFEILYLINGMTYKKVIEAKNDVEAKATITKTAKNAKIVSIKEGVYVKNEKNNTKTFMVVKNYFSNNQIQSGTCIITVQPNQIYNLYTNLNNIALSMFVTLMIVILFFITYKSINRYKLKKYKLKI